MNKILDNKVAIITGGGSGIGEGITRIFIEKGLRVLIVGRTEAKLKKVVSEMGVSSSQLDYFVADVSSYSDMEKVLKQTEKKFGGLDILIQNAGVFGSKNLDEMTPVEWQHVIANNLTSSFNAIQTSIPLLKKANQGRIVFISSIAGAKVGLPKLAHYTAAKAGVNGLMRTAALEMAQYNITVNSISPGNILNFVPNEEEKLVIDDEVKAIPMGRVGLPSDVGHLAFFLASDEASFITGQNFVIDGGQTILPDFRLIHS